LQAGLWQNIFWEANSVANPTIYRYPRQIIRNPDDTITEVERALRQNGDVFRDCLLAKVPYTVSLEFPARATAEEQSIYEIELTETDE
jgi:hypothetical protein